MTYDMQSKEHAVNLRTLSPKGCVRPTCKKAGRHAGMAVRDAKTLRPMFAVGRPRCKNLAADVCGWPSEMQKTLRPMFAVGRPRCKKLGGRCLRLAVRDAKTLRPMFAVGCPRCKKLCGCGQSFLHLGQPTANIGRRLFASRAVNRKHQPQSFLHLGRPTANIGRRLFCISRPTVNIGRRVYCISDGQPRGSTWKAFLHLGPTPNIGRGSTVSGVE